MAPAYKQYYSETRNDLLNLIPGDRDYNCTLDVGCGVGNTSLQLGKIFNVKETVGLEIQEDIAQKARGCLDRVYNMSAESESLPFNAKEFDLIIFADVLEHLYDPWTTLERYKKFLKPNGLVLISLPNIQNWRIIYNLIRGRWQYTDYGIMDKTHVRFFTVSSAAEMVKKSGLKVKRLERTMGTLLSAINVLTFGIFRDHFTFHIYILAKNDD